MLFYEIDSRSHECAAELGMRIAIESVEIILIIRCKPGFNRIMTDAELRPPCQMAI
jgi:hypothetical protein